MSVSKVADDAPLMGGCILFRRQQLDVTFLTVKRSPHVLIQRLDVSHHGLRGPLTMRGSVWRPNRTAVLGTNAR